LIGVETNHRYATWLQIKNTQKCLANTVLYVVIYFLEVTQRSRRGHQPHWAITIEDATRKPMTQRTSWLAHDSVPVESKQQLRVASHPFRLRLVRHLPPSRRTQLGQRITPARAKGESCPIPRAPPCPSRAQIPRRPRGGSAPAGPHRGYFAPTGSGRGRLFYFFLFFGLKS
jgi:hypothetical protein